MTRTSPQLHKSKALPSRGLAKHLAALGHQVGTQEFVDLVLYATGLDKHSAVLDLSGISQVNTANITALCKKLPNLRRLNLKGTPLGELPEAVTRLGGLQELDLSNTRLSAVARSIGGMQALRYLDLSHNALATLPPEVGHLQELRYFNVSRNQLHSLCEAIGYLGRLRVLRMAVNLLSTLPRTLGALSRLQVLHVSLNQLVALPTELGGMQALRVLNVAGNRLTTLPESLARLPNLKTLNATSNCMTALAPCLHHMAYRWRLDPLPKGRRPSTQSAPATASRDETRAIVKQDALKQLEHSTPVFATQYKAPPPLPVHKSSPTSSCDVTINLKKPPR